MENLESGKEDICTREGGACPRLLSSGRDFQTVEDRKQGEGPVIHNEVVLHQADVLLCRHQDDKEEHEK